jgi:hypothetical protein
MTLPSDHNASVPEREIARRRHSAVTLAALATVAVALVLVVPGTSLAKPPSFAIWWSHFSARVQRDVVRVTQSCQKTSGRSDARIGACFVKHERVSLRLERAAWERQLARITHGQKAACKHAIAAYGAATRKAATANLRYLDTHRRSALSAISRDLNGQPFAGLKTLTFAAKARAVRICR